LMDEKLQPPPARSLVRTPSDIVTLPEVAEVSSEENPHLRDYIQIVLKRRWVVLSCLFIAFGTAMIGTLKQKPVYRGTVILEINPEQPNVLNLKDVLQVGAMMDAETYRATQIQVFNSRSLAGRVVQKLQLQNQPDFRPRKLFGLMQAKALAESRKQRADTSSDTYRAAVDHFLDSVDAKPRLRTSLVEVSFDATDAALAARVANQLADEYIYQNLQAKWDATQKASEWLSGRLEELKARLEKSEDLLQAYAQAKSLVFVADKQNLVNTRLEQLQLEYTRAQLDRFQKESLAKLVESGKAEDLPGFINDKLIQDLESRLTDLQREYAKVTASVKPEHPRAVQIQKQIDSVNESLGSLKKLVADNVTHEYQASVQHEKFLADAIEQQKKEVNDVAEKSIQYNFLKREAETNRQLFDALLQKLKESQVQAGMSANNIRIVDPAEVPKKPVRPRVLLNLALGIALGLMSGVGLAFFQEYMDKTVKTPDDVERLLRLPALGLLPKFSLNEAGADKSVESRPPRLLPSNGAKSVAAGIETDPTTVEAFRTLRTSILLSADPVPKTLLVTSALPSEGKTTVTINLGATLASLGSKVVIVDCDMRRPNCHRLTGVENKPGFVQCLTSRVELADAILPVPGVENLSVIPCGPIPPNPTEVLSSARTHELLQKLRSEFEYVLVDSPPLLSVADGRILSILVDGVVLVVRGYMTPYDIVRRARASLYGAGARILGVALNNVDLQRDGYAYGYYKYGYGYGYGSDYRDQDSEVQRFDEDD